MSGTVTVKVEAALRKLIAAIESTYQSHVDYKILWRDVSTPEKLREKMQYTKHYRSLAWTKLESEYQRFLHNGIL